MSPDKLENAIDRLHSDLGFKRLNPLWAKAEIVLGLFAVATGLLVMMKLAVRPEAEGTDLSWLGPVLLFVLGGYLTLAGHRSHLYQSNNRLAAHLADLVRKNSTLSEKPP